MTPTMGSEQCAGRPAARVLHIHAVAAGGEGMGLLSPGLAGGWMRAAGVQLGSMRAQRLAAMNGDQTNRWTSIPAVLPPSQAIQCTTVPAAGFEG